MYGMVVANFYPMQKTVLGRIGTFNFKKVKSTFIVLAFLFSLAGCGDSINLNDHLTALPDDSTGSNPSSSFDHENSSDSANSALEDSVKLSWLAPATNADGTPLTDLGGYIVYYAEKTSIDYTYSIDVGNSTFVSINDLSPGTWCFAVASYDFDGNESDYSFEACKDIS